MMSELASETLKVPGELLLGNEFTLDGQRSWSLTVVTGSNSFKKKQGQREDSAFPQTSLCLG